MSGSTGEVRAEEREARERQRKAERALALAHKANAKIARRRRADVIRAELAKPRAARCACGITPRMSIAELMELGSGCTGGMYVCPTLDAIRRQLGR